MEGSDEEKLTVAQAADYLGTTPKRVHHLRVAKQLNGTKIANLIYFTRQELDEYLLRKTNPSTALEPIQEHIEEVTVQESVASKKMPACYRCGKRFITKQDYKAEEFEDEQGEAIFKPVCKGGCDAIDYKAKYEELLEALKRLIVEQE